MTRRRSLTLLALLVAGVALAHLGSAALGRDARTALGTARMAQSDGVRIRFYTAGQGDPVVLLASLGRPASDWNELALALVSAGFRTLAIESRGIGGSGGGGPFADTTLRGLARDVLAVLAESHIGADVRVDLIGHAFGNRVARTFAVEHPARTRRLVLIAAGGRESVPREIKQAVAVSLLDFLPDRLRLPSLRRAFFAEESEIPEHWRRGWSVWGALSQFRAVDAGEPDAFWAGGEAPMLVLQADGDAVAPAEGAGIALVDEFPERVTLVGVPRAGHALLAEQPDHVEVEVLAFLGEPRGTAGAVR